MSHIYRMLRHAFSHVLHRVQMKFMTPHTAHCTPPAKFTSTFRCRWITGAAFCLAATLYAAPPNRDEVIQQMEPYHGESNPGVDPTTMQGKVLCGYQGWFTTPGDGSDRSWAHYGRRGRFEPGRC